MSSNSELPKYLKLQKAQEITRVPRAKSAHDLFVKAYPEIGREARKAAAAEGVVGAGAVQKRVNNAYSAAWQQAPNKEEFEEQSKEDKARKAKEREAAKVKQEVEASDPTPEGQQKS